MVLVLVLYAAATAQPRTLIRARSGATARDRAIVAAINAFRAQNLLPRLRVDLRLARAARAHSQDMLRRDYFGHGNLAARMSHFHVRGTLFEENLACSSGVLSGQQVLADWLASPPHRATLLDPNLRRIGVAAPVGPFEGFPTVTLVTADFAG